MLKIYGWCLKVFIVSVTTIQAIVVLPVFLPFFFMCAWKGVKNLQEAFLMTARLVIGIFKEVYANNKYFSSIDDMINGPEDR